MEAITPESLKADFERLLNEEGRKIYREGDLVKGKVLAIHKDVVIVDIGFKSEGIVPANEFRGPRGEVTIKVGDEVEVLLECLEDDDGSVVLSKERADALKTWDTLVAIMDSDGVVGRHRREGLSAGLAD